MIKILLMIHLIWWWIICTNTNVINNANTNLQALRNWSTWSKYSVKISTWWTLLKTTRNPWLSQYDIRTCLLELKLLVLKYIDRHYYMGRSALRGPGGGQPIGDMSIQGGWWSAESVHSFFPLYMPNLTYHMLKQAHAKALLGFLVKVLNRLQSHFELLPEVNPFWLCENVIFTKTIDPWGVTSPS